MPAPKLVCMSMADEKGNVSLHEYEESLSIIENRLLKETTGNHHIFYDLGVVAAERPHLLPAIFDGFDEGRFHCTKIRQMMIDNAEGNLKFIWNDETMQYNRQNYQLYRLVQRLLGYDIQKHKEQQEGESKIWRLRFNELDGIPISEWPTEPNGGPAAYAMGDPKYTRDVWHEQQKLIEPDEIPGYVSEMQAAWALNLMSTWGFRTDPAAVREYKAELTVDFKKTIEQCREFGFRRGTKGDYSKKARSRDMKKIKAAVEDWFSNHNPTDIKMLITDGGDIATSREQLTNTDHPGLHAVAESVKTEKMLTTYVTALERGTVVPINPSYNPIIETFRTSCSGGMKIDGIPVGLNIQNLPRKGKVRECVIPRPGNVFAFCDYDTLEMRTLAQVCLELFGKSEIAIAANAGVDFHTALAATLYGISYGEAMRRLEAGDPEMATARQYCFHPETEALTRKGWKKIGDLGFDDEVAAAIPENGGIRIEWQKPTALTRRPAKELVHLSCEGMDLRVTDNHRMLAFKIDGSFEETTPLELPRKRGWYNTGTAPGGDWDPDETLLRLAVATQADGTYRSLQTGFGFTKKRKIERMRALLEDIPHRESVSSQGAAQGRRCQRSGFRAVTTRTTGVPMPAQRLQSCDGENNYAPGRRTPPGPAKAIKEMLTDKCFDERWLNLSQRGRQIVLDEARHWDSSSTGRSVSYTFASMIKKNAEILQIVATLEGRKTRLVQDTHNQLWKLTVRDHDTRKNDRSRGDNLKAEKIEYDGDVVCLTVPSTYVVVRDGGIPVITGNCKIGNYGLSGGMGPHAFIAYAKGYGITVSLSQAKAVKAGFLKQWPEMRDYFNYCGFLCREGNATHVVFPRSGQVRGNVRYTAVCNGFFQHRAAKGAKRALYLVAKECYVDSGTPLYGCRPWLFAHDEIGMEVPYDAFGPQRSHMAVMRLQELMIQAMKFWCPDVAIGATAAMSRRWYKGAKTIIKDGYMVPSKPINKGNKTEWVADLVA
jgi:hypothetical protein